MDGGMNTTLQHGEAPIPGPLEKPSMDSGEQARGVVLWAKWLGLVAIILFALVYMYGTLLLTGAITRGQDILALMISAMYIEDAPLFIAIWELLFFSIISIAIAWFYYYPKSIRPFLLLAAGAELLDEIHSIMTEGHLSLSEWLFALVALAVIIACIFVVKPFVFSDGTPKAQRVWVGILYIVAIAQWLAIRYSAITLNEYRSDKTILIFLFLATGLLLSRMKLGWFAGIASSVLLFIMFFAEGYEYNSLANGPFLPLLIYILLFLPPVIRWYFPQGIWAYVRSLAVKRG
jgi:hypothetical protein